MKFNNNMLKINPTRKIQKLFKNTIPGKCSTAAEIKSIDVQIAKFYLNEVELISFNGVFCGQWQLK